MNQELTAVGTSNTGTFEEGDTKHDYKHFRHSLDDSYMLYRSGGPKLDIFDLSNGTVDENIPTFWIMNNNVMKPIAAVGSADANKILGVSTAKLSNNADEFYFHYYERIGEKADTIINPDKKVLESTSRLSSD